MSWGCTTQHLHTHPIPPPGAALPEGEDEAAVDLKSLSDAVSLFPPPPSLKIWGGVRSAHVTAADLTYTSNAAKKKNRSLPKI